MKTTAGNRYIFFFLAATVLLALAFYFLPLPHSSVPAYRIGVSQPSNDSWRETMNEEMRREEMFHNNVSVEILSADNDNVKQMADVRHFIDSQVDLILVSPNDPDCLIPLLEEAQRKGIRVVTFDRRISNPIYTTHIEVDNEALGRSVADYARSLFPHGARIIEIEGNINHSAATDRHKGFCSGIAAHPEMQLLASVPANWDFDITRRVADSLLEVYPGVDLVYAHSDGMAINAAEVLRERGLTDRVKLLGIDGIAEVGLKAVADSVITATFLYPTYGYLILRTALDILDGKPVDHEIILPPVSAVDLHNADILRQQVQMQHEETEKIVKLRDKLSDFATQYHAQKMLLYAALIFVIAIIAVILVLLRTMRHDQRHRRELTEKNQQLELEKRKQEALYEQLADATQAKIDFFTNVSHDFRTPLTLLGSIEELLKDDTLSPQQSQLLGIAHRNTAILRRLIDQLLDFRKYETGKVQLALTEVSIYPLLQGWVSSFEVFARKRSMHFDIRMDSQEPLTMAIDVEKLERIVFNIVSNAFKYTPTDGGSIVFEAHHADGQLTFSVRDTGRGISTEQQRHIFDRFYRVDNASAGGSGIGLALTKAFVELHGGNITVESEVGQGSCFTVSIPIVHTGETKENISTTFTEETILNELDVTHTQTLPQPSPAPQPLTSSLTPRPLRLEREPLTSEKPLLLVIDDNADIRLMIRTLLGSEYTILEAADGRQGVEIATQYVPDVILCDVMMPVMDGLECCRRLKQEMATCHIPVLMLTACSLDEQRIKGYDSGADGYISKPFSMDVLRARLRNLIAGRRILDIHYLTKSTPAPQPDAAKASHDTAHTDTADLTNAETDTANLTNAETDTANLTNAETDTAAMAQTATTAETAPADMQNAAKRDNEFLQRVLDIINKEYGNPDLNIEQIAAAVYLSQSQFSRKVKALTGYTSVELIRRFRVERGHELLTTTDRSISEIAYQVGFSDPNYFSKCYKQMYGETPKELRARHTS